MLAFRELEIDDAKLILDWRTQDRVTRYMNTDVVYDIDAQKQWLKNSFTRPDYYHWIVQYNGKDVGFLNIVDWNPGLKETFWGFYIGDDSALGIGGIVPPCLYKFAFEVLGVESVKAAIFYDNVKVIQLHRIQGYKFEPSRDHVIKKNGNDILMVCMTLDKHVFEKKGFSRLKAKLPTKKWEVSRELAVGE